MVVALPPEWWLPTMAAGARHGHAVRVTAVPYSAVRRARTSMRPVQPVVRVADEDAGLLAAIPEPLAGAARQQLVARTTWVESGRWDPLANDLPADFGGWLGLFVLEGLLVREVRIDELRCCELLGPGDLLRPWDENEGAETIECQTAWRVLEPVRLALLDEAFARRAGRWPSIGGELLQRSLRRTRSQSVLLALTQARRADVRLRTLFAHLADRWGRVTPEGIVVPLRLTHRVIAQLTGLRRPSVSISLAELEREGEIVRLSKDAWLIALPAA
jgi:CRP-like cAMP-binding protein